MNTSPKGARLSSDHADRMARARLSLDGLSVGDALGERFFYKSDVAWLISARAVPKAPWRYTDDTMMALSIVEVLDQRQAIDADMLAEKFAARYQLDPGRGYGPTAMEILEDIGRGLPWQTVSKNAFHGMGSMGNGSTMRPVLSARILPTIFMQLLRMRVLRRSSHMLTQKEKQEPLPWRLPQRKRGVYGRRE